MPDQSEREVQPSRRSIILGVPVHIAVGGASLTVFGGSVVALNVDFSRDVKSTQVETLNYINNLHVSGAVLEGEVNRSGAFSYDADFWLRSRSAQYEDTILFEVGRWRLRPGLASKKLIDGVARFVASISEQFDNSSVEYSMETIGRADGANASESMSCRDGYATSQLRQRIVGIFDRDRETRFSYNDGLELVELHLKPGDEFSNQELAALRSRSVESAAMEQLSRELGTDGIPCTRRADVFCEKTPELRSAQVRVRVERKFF